MDRYEQELDILERISQILGDGLEINEVFQRAMALISEKLEIQRACLLLRDDATDMGDGGVPATADPAALPGAAEEAHGEQAPKPDPAPVPAESEEDAAQRTHQEWLRQLTAKTIAAAAAGSSFNKKRRGSQQSIPHS